MALSQSEKKIGFVGMYLIGILLLASAVLLYFVGYFSGQIKYDQIFMGIVALTVAIKVHRSYRREDGNSE